MYTKLVCPHCKAALEVEEGIDEFTCPSCGSNIILENSPVSRNIHSGTPSFDDHSVNENWKGKTPLQMFLRGLISLIIVVAVILIGAEIIINGQLEARVDSFYSYKATGKYDRAENEIDKIFYPGFFPQRRTYWENIKNTLEEQLNESITNSQPIRLDFSHKEALKKDYPELKESLEKAGFTNIHSEIITEEPKWPRKAHNGQVESITIAGKDNFKKNDEFPPIALIKIVYYELP